MSIDINMQECKQKRPFRLVSHSLPDTITYSRLHDAASLCTPPYTQLPTLTSSKFLQETETIPLDGFYAVLEPWSDIKNTHLLGTFSKSRQILHIHEENIQKHYRVVLEFLIFWRCVTMKPLNGNIMFKSHSNTRATEWWLNHGNRSKWTKTYHFLRKALFVSAYK